MNYTDIKELLKDARDFAEGANDLQLKGKLLDIQGALYDLIDENRDLRIENERLKNVKITESQMKQVGSFWKIEDKEYYYCPKCWGKDKRLVVCVFNKTYPVSTFLCPVCGFSSRYYQ